MLPGSFVLAQKELRELAEQERGIEETIRTVIASYCGLIASTDWSDTQCQQTRTHTDSTIRPAAVEARWSYRKTTRCINYVGHVQLFTYEGIFG
jgi:hypothetical protein